MISTKSTISEIFSQNDPGFVYTNLHKESKTSHRAQIPQDRARSSQGKCESIKNSAKFHATLSKMDVDRGYEAKAIPPAEPHGLDSSLVWTPEDGQSSLFGSNTLTHRKGQGKAFLFHQE